MVAVPEWIKMQLRIATDGRCNGCGEAGRGLDPHHRQPRGMGGDPTGELDDIRNFLALCRFPCHDMTEALPLDAQRLGWLVPRGYDVKDIPARIYTPQGFGWWLLTAPPHPRSTHPVLAYEPCSEELALGLMAKLYGQD